MNILTDEYRQTDTHFYFWNTPYSQWYADYEKTYLFYENDKHFFTAEHYMMYYKGKLFGCKNTMETCLKNPSPRKAKEAGRLIKNYDDAVWNRERMGIVTNGNVLKFVQNPSLLEMMKGHKDLILVEASPKDKIWGIGLHFDNEDVLDESKWKGQNLLGKCIMNARDIILK